MKTDDVLSIFGAFAGLAAIGLSVYAFVFLCLWPWLIYYKLKELVKISKEQTVELELIRSKLPSPPQMPKS